MTENTLACGGKVQGVERAGISLGTHGSKHISCELLCTGLLLSTFTPPRDNARPVGTRDPSHRDSRTSVWGFLLLIYGWIPRAKPTCGRPSGKLSPCSKQLPEAHPLALSSIPQGLATEKPSSPSPRGSVGRTGKCQT